MNNNEQIVTEKQVRNKTLLAFLFFLLFIAGCIGAWKWLEHEPKEQGALKPLRAGLNTNESIFSFFLENNQN
jgi:hypothetical protein